ncbi:conserved oligomeric Golgi complex subunit 6-like [Tropilaelaps mercedesae]|uniref:Conserved oligomeric Golgi complex subunit 6 n=1 Tax=Tropilaelaps mercedesae TaxID=418985 RepID=A0A1V9X8W4_9ACAR|nr:conserved oligomeric Golgi complex subunit 6-like [Tropilaelaps mercedesae]
MSTGSASNVEPGGQPAGTFLQKKLSNVFEMGLENDRDTLEILAHMSTFVTENNLRTRRNLRGEIEKQNLAVNQEFFEALRTLKEQVDSLCEDIHVMSSCCEEMIHQLNSTKEKTHGLISKTSKMKKESSRLERNHALVKALLDHFQLNQEEIRLLHGSPKDLTVEEGFYAALDKLRRIHDDCKHLVRSQQPTAGLEIMENMTLHMEAAYEHLFRWIQSECRLTTDETALFRLSRGLAALHARPLLFKKALTEYANARRAAVLRSLIDALTRATPGGGRPIEFYSRDALRYIGDIMAWVHQTVATERENFKVLVVKCETCDLETMAGKAIAHITEGLSLPIKQRLEHIMTQETNTVTLYRIWNMMNFYNASLDIRPLDPTDLRDSLLCVALSELLALSKKLFTNSLIGNTSRLLERVESPPADLGPPQCFQTILTLLRQILSCQDSLLAEERQQDIGQILNLMIDPLLQSCQLSASKLQAPADMATYITNCLYTLSTVLCVYEHTESKLEMCKAQVDAHLATLVSEQCAHLLGSLDMSALYRMTEEFSMTDGGLGGPASQLSGCDSIAVQTFVHKLEEFLDRPDLITIPQVYLLLSGLHRQEVRQRTLVVLCDSYDKLHKIVKDPRNGYSDMQLRAPEDVRNTLLPSTK